MKFAPQSIELTTITGQPVKLHLVSTGAVIVKTKFREAKHSGLRAVIDFILDRKYSEWLPIWVLIIEHPEGIFVIDTGENSNINDPDYFKGFGFFTKWFNTTQYKFQVDRDEEIDKQLQLLGISINKINKVILTHLHLDHVDGLRHFPATPVLVNESEWKRPYGDLPKLYPSWFKPGLISLNERFDVFDKAYYITQAKDLVLVETPGHTWHHCSVILKTSRGHLFFGADVCYSEDQIMSEKYSGANASHKLAIETYSKIRSFCKQHETVFIPSHEEAGGARLTGFQRIIL